MLFVHVMLATVAASCHVRLKVNTMKMAGWKDGELTSQTVNQPWKYLTSDFLGLPASVLIVLHVLIFFRPKARVGSLFLRKLKQKVL